jgi:hypothetical protein
MTYSYKTNCGQYVLHCEDKPIGPLLDEVSLAFDRDEGVLHKHGAPAMVEAWQKGTQAKLRASGLTDMADSIVVITGRFELDDLNRCLTHTGYVGTLYTRLLNNELAPLSCLPSP